MCMKASKWSATHVRAVSLLLLVAAFANTSLAAPDDVDLTFEAGPASVHPVFWVLVGKKGLPEKD